MHFLLPVSDTPLGALFAETRGAPGNFETDRVLEGGVLAEGTVVEFGVAWEQGGQGGQGRGVEIPTQLQGDWREILVVVVGRWEGAGQSGMGVHPVLQPVIQSTLIHTCTCIYL